MNSIDIEIDAEALVDEIVRYLAAVNVFRDLGRPPVWKPETPPPCGSEAPNAS